MLRDDFALELLQEYEKWIADTGEHRGTDLIYHLIKDSQNQMARFDKEYIDYFPVAPAEAAREEMNSLISFMLQEIQEQKAGFASFIKGAFCRMFLTMDDPRRYSANRIRSDSDSQKYLFSKISHILRANHGRCMREELSAQLHYNGEYLNRIMKKWTGKTILEYGRSLYMEEAARMLTETDKNISAIIAELGFSNRNHFYHLFQDTYGKTPMEYRNSEK